MTWTYSGNPTESDLMALRFAIQDTVEADPQFTDEELGYLLGAAGGSVTRATVAAIETLVAKYSRQADRTVGDLSVSASQRADHYRELLAQVQGSASAGALVAPAAPAVFTAQRADYDPDGALVEPTFTRDPERYRKQV